MESDIVGNGNRTLSVTEPDIGGGGAGRCRAQTRTLSGTDESQSWNHRHLCWAKCPFGGLSIIKTALGPIALLVAHGLSKGQLSGLSMKSWTLHPASYTLKSKLSEGLWQLTALVRLWENKPLKAQKAPPSTEQAAATEIYIHTFVAWCPSSIFCERCLSPNSHIIALPQKYVFVFCCRI